MFIRHEILTRIDPYPFVTQVFILWKRMKRNSDSSSAVRRIGAATAERTALADRDYNTTSTNYSVDYDKAAKGNYYTKLQTVQSS